MHDDYGSDLEATSLIPMCLIIVILGYMIYGLYLLISNMFTWIMNFLGK